MDFSTLDRFWDLIPTGLFRCEAAHGGHLLWANSVTLKLFGYATLEEARYVPIHAFFPDRAAHDHLHARMLQVGRLQVEIPLLRQDGTAIWVSIAAELLRDERGEPQWIDGVVQDITERRRTELERQRLSERLMEVQETERKNISSMLHDHLGQLLTLTRLELESLGTAKDTAAVRHRLTRRVDEALAAVRDMAVALRPPQLDHLELDAALEYLVDDFRRGSRLDFSYACTPGLPVVPLPLKTAFYRVLQELLTNVVRHAVATRIEVLVTLENRHLTLFVADNGTGFDPNRQPVSGGMGLYSIRERLRQVNGALVVDTAPGRGSRITALAPLDPAADLREGAPA